MIRLNIPSIEQDDLEAVRAVLETGFLVQGPRVAAFEAELARLTGAPHAVAVSNCTAALHLGLLALGVGPGDLVAVTAFSWISTANVIELCGAQPVFVDIDASTFNMCPESLAERVGQLAACAETRRKLKAVIPVHTFGQMADVDAIGRVAAEHGLPVMEDAACALGATWNGKQAGTAGTLGCFSFHPRKAVTTGEGGAIVTHDAALARTLRALRNHGMDPEAGGPDFVMPGLNCRMTDFQAALGSTQLTKLTRITSARQRLAKRYDMLLAGAPVATPAVPEGSAHVYQSYVVLLPEAAAPERPSILRRMREAGVETTIGTWHMPMTTYFKARYGYTAGDFPRADAVFARALTLPLYEHMTDDEQQTVVRALRDVLA